MSRRHLDKAAPRGRSALLVEEQPDPALDEETQGVASRQGTVFRKSQGQYAVISEGQTVNCVLSNRLRKQLIYPIADPGSLHQRVVAVADIRAVDPVAIGDVVRFLDARDGTGMIAEVLPRQSKLARRAAGPKPLEQVIVANVDQVLVITAAAQPAPSWELVDRYLAAAEAADLPARVCLTKADLADDLPHAEFENYRRLGYPVHLTSSLTGEGLDELKAALTGKLSVLTGKSGVGKTTLLNALQPELGLRVGAVSEQTGKGRHTTSHLELFALDGGGSVVDTPGMREFGLWDLDGVDLANAFPDLRPFVGRCRFGLSCQHRQEPGCAIRTAVEAGEVSERRYRSYLRLAE